MKRWALAAAACLAIAGAQAQIAPQDRRSGFDFMSPSTQAMQRDDTQNPGMLSVLDGEALWRAPAGPEGKTCAGCHGEPASLRGVAARHPAPAAEGGRIVDLQGRVNLCRTERQGAPAFAYESRELLALTTLVGLQSRGLPASPAPGAAMDAARARGRALYTQRLGQLNFSCAQCHDALQGGRLGSAPIPQAHPTGYPIYRLEWQSTGSLQRRFRNCMSGVRAEPFAYGAPEFIDLEAFLMERAAGMAMETPGVRP